MKTEKTIEIVNTITFVVLAILVALGINKSIDPKDQLTAYALLAILCFVFALRKLPGMDVLWYILKMAIIGLFVIIFADQAKKELKEWWNK